MIATGEVGKLNAANLRNLSFENYITKSIPTYGEDGGFISKGTISLRQFWT
jgi:hypothetical protein